MFAGLDVNVWSYEPESGQSCRNWAADASTSTRHTGHTLHHCQLLAEREREYCVYLMQCLNPLTKGDPKRNVKCSASDIYDLGWKHFWAKYKWDCILFLSTFAMGQAEIHTKCILKQLNTFLEVGSNALQEWSRKFGSVNISIMHLLLRSQLSTQEVWKRWRQASLLTMLPEMKSPRQITQLWLPSFSLFGPSLGLNTAHLLVF